MVIGLLRRGSDIGGIFRQIKKGPGIDLNMPPKSWVRAPKPPRPSFFKFWILSCYSTLYNLYDRRKF